MSLVARGRLKMPPLVVAGPPGWRGRAVRAQLRTPGIVYLGFLPTAEVALVMSGAAALVYPSLYEGFGLPVLEAMACGTPVVTSGVGGLGEVAGDSALIVDPEDVESIAAGIARVLDNGALHRELARRGVERARVFSWDRAARETLRVYEMCHAQFKREAGRT
jgi:glycosyltransferase involved in cell wall biosynthesis